MVKNRLRILIQMTQEEKLKSMREFPEDVKEGDIVRIVLEKQGVFVGHAHQETVPLWHKLKRVRLSVSQNPKIIEDEVESAHNQSDYEEFLYMLGDEEFVYEGFYEGDSVRRGERILGYEVLKRNQFESIQLAQGLINLGREIYTF